ncbi:thermonuclease family protein [Sulfurospirillum oryzae]|uniref:thermonuclease family protein n=1 Tax=Sulfurospirillum oryzae TaxID=2976535 RepID=UPI0021E7B48B|nr:thermonuclease family protein [Sulfurospirillum oryzae]
MFRKLVIASMLSTLPLFAAESTGIVTKVTDGEVFHIMIDKKEEKVRVLYIQTPLKNSGTKLEKDAKRAGILAKDEQELGKLASEYASKFFKKGDKVVVDSDKKDQSGRMLATVSKDGVDYSSQIIKDGYACIYKKVAYPGELEKDLKSAKEAKKGLWAINFDAMNKWCR